MKRLCLLIALVALCPSAVPAASIAWPVQVSPNGRYFVDHQGRPVFWLGTTQWELFRGYTLQDARLILDKSKDKGFVFVQTMLVGVGDGTGANVSGQKPWLNDDPRTPNETYFQNVDAVIQAARERDMILYLMVYHQTCRKHITLDNARAWAKWLAQRYQGMPNIVWSLTPEAKPEFVPILRELAAGLREGDGGAHLITVEPDPSPYSSSFLHDERWLDFNSLQTWKDVELIYSMVRHDCNLQPVKPVLMAEGAYEHGSEYGFEVTPLWVRRQAYYSYLAGGHHAYGHNDSWRILPTWEQALDAPALGKWASCGEPSKPGPSGGCWFPINRCSRQVGRRVGGYCIWRPATRRANGPCSIWRTRRSSRSISLLSRGPASVRPGSIQRRTPP